MAVNSTVESTQALSCMSVQYWFANALDGAASMLERLTKTWPKESFQSVRTQFQNFEGFIIFRSGKL